jgi:putative hemolysin
MIWLLAIACWLISFLFAGIEAGLLALDPVRLRTQAKSGLPAAVRLEKLLRHPERLFITVLLLTNAADIVALVILAHRLMLAFHLAGYALAILIALPLYLFGLNVLPKSLFRRFPLRAVARFSRLLEFATKILWPVLSVGEWIARHVFARGKAAPRLFAAREELKQITIQSERGGALTSAERAIIHNVVDFTSVKVRDVMVPLAKTVSLSLEETPERVLQLSEQAGIDRFPVVEKSRAIGLINVFDILVDTAAPQNLREYMRRIITASESESAYRVVRRLRAARIGLAAVVDSRQTFAGIVALEDLIRHLVRG